MKARWFAVRRGEGHPDGGPGAGNGWESSCRLSALAFGQSCQESMTLRPLRTAAEGRRNRCTRFGFRSVMASS
jgi:hypothetical protein